MLNDIYTAVKTQLNTLATPLDVQWFNMQYDGVMPYESGFFVEFPDALQFDEMSKQARSTPLKIRIHAYTKVIGTSDGVPDASVATHETQALAAKDKLEAFVPLKVAEKLSTPLRFRGWQHWHKWKGWMVTYVDFECKKRI